MKYLFLLLIPSLSYGISISNTPTIDGHNIFTGTNNFRTGYLTINGVPVGSGGGGIGQTNISYTAVTNAPWITSWYTQYPYVAITNSPWITTWYLQYPYSAITNAPWGLPQTNISYTAITNSPWLTAVQIGSQIGSSNFVSLGALLNGTNLWAGTNTFTVGTRTFTHDSSHTVITNSATLTGNEWTDGQEKYWYNGSNTILVDKTNGSVTFNGTLTGNGSGLTNLLSKALKTLNVASSNALVLNPSGVALEWWDDSAQQFVYANYPVLMNGGSISNIQPSLIASGTAGISITGSATTATSATNLVGTIWRGISNTATSGTNVVVSNLKTVIQHGSNNTLVVTNGNVGIGTENPTSLLTLGGKMTWTTGLGAMSQIVGPTDQVLQITGGTNGRGLMLNTGTGGDASTYPGFTSPITISAASYAANDGYDAYGGPINITAGNGVRNGTGGNVTITAGDNSSSVSAGNISINSGRASSGINGSITLISGSTSISRGENGGAISLVVGAVGVNSLAGDQAPIAGGNINLTGQVGAGRNGNASPAAAGSSINLALGAGGADLTVSGTGANGGAFNLNGGAGGNVTANSGTNISGNGSTLTLTSGSGGSATGSGGIQIGGNSGNIVFNVGTNGTGSTANGSYGIIQFNIPTATNQMTIRSTGITVIGPLTITNGICSYSLIAPQVIPSAGWTNIWSTNNAVCYLNLVAATVTIYNGSGTSLRTNATFTGIETVELHPAWGFNITGTLTDGNALPW